MGFENILKQIISFVNEKLNKQQKIIVVATMTILLAFIGFLITMDTTKQNVMNSDYKVLFESLSNKDSALVIEQLKRENIEYIISNNKIYVPKKVVYEQRIKLAAAGIPKDSTIGFELFDKDSFGSTSFEQKIKFLRAIEGELERTIETLKPIKSASVHIAIPDETVFVAKEVPPSASVTLEILPNMRLGSKQVEGIKRLVASGVSKLTIKNISVIDSLGQPLDSDTKISKVDRLADIQMTYKKKFEKNYEKKIIDILSPFVGGKNSVTARVTVDFDFTSKQSTKEDFSPNNVVRSEQLLEEKKDGYRLKDPGGVPGAVSNIGPVQGVDAQGNKEKYSKTTSTTNYEISKVVSTIEDEFAKVVRINAAVVVDGTYSIKTDQNGEKELVYKPRDKKEIKQMEDLVKRTIGFNEKRKDKVTVSNFRFSFPHLKKIETKLDMLKKIYINNQGLIRYTIAAIVFLLMYKLVVARFIEKMMESYIDDTDRNSALVKLSDIEEEEDNINQSDEMRKKIQEQLNAKEVDEQQIKYEIMFEKIKDYLSDSPEEAGALFTALIKADKNG